VTFVLYPFGGNSCVLCKHTYNDNQKSRSICTRYLCIRSSNVVLCLEYFRYEYRWADGVQIKKPIEVSAPKYVEYLMDWIEAQLDDESIFPQKLGEDFNILFLH